MRGKDLYLYCFLQYFGITPAHAGKSAVGGLVRGGLVDHPRTCGEKLYVLRDKFAQEGSPPHMRGKGGGGRTIGLVGGITPAHAGKRTIQRDGYDIDRDHPRTCGEKVGFIGSGGRTEGSPPHMRGKASASALIRSSAGITPAHAGKRAFHLICGIILWDHPRTCGEKLLSNPSTKKQSGSPPHMRGKANLKGASFLTLGITPAHAGKSVREPIQVFGAWDHPRTCGEKRLWGKCNLKKWGSPPHMRGKEILQA